MADLDAIKAPIPGDVPGGIYLKGDRAAYRGLRNAFNAAQSAHRALSETQESLTDRTLQETNANAWAALSEAAETTLTETAKDLEILCWWVAAQIHLRDPLPRTAEALTALADLVEADLDGLQPIPPDDKLKGDTDEARAAEIAELKLRPFVQLFGEVDGSGLLFVPVTNTDLGAEVTYGAYLMAERGNDFGPLKAKFAALLPAGEAALTARAEALGTMAAQVARLGDLLRRYASAHGQEPPPSGYLHRHLGKVLNAIARMTEGTGFRMPGTEEEAEAPADTSAEPAAEGAAAPQAAAGPGVALSANIAGREAALAQIAELARYFRKTEPHSPISTLLDRAVRWGQMHAEELFQEILRDGSEAFNQMTLLTGLESAGFAERFNGKSGAAGKAVEMPQLDRYDAPTPRPAAQSGAAPAAAAAADSPPPAKAEPEAKQPPIAKFEL